MVNPKGKNHDSGPSFTSRIKTYCSHVELVNSAVMMSGNAVFENQPFLIWMAAGK
jgi:hypothetical protein